MAFGGLKGTLSGSATSITNPISATGSVVVAVGDLVFAVGFEQTLNTWGTTATDNLGNTYAAVSAGSLANAVVSARAYYSRVTVAGTLTSVNLPATASADNAVVLAAVIEGPFVTSPLDKAPADVTQDLSTPYTGPSTTTLSQALEVVMAWMGQNGNVTLTATSPNLKAIQLNTASILTGVIGYQAVTVTTAISPAWTSTATPTSDVIGTASFKKNLLQTLTPGVLTDAEGFFAPTVTAATVAASFTSYALSAPLRYREYITLSEIISPAVIGSPAQSVSPALITDSEVFFSPTIRLNVSPSLFTDSETFFSPTIKLSVSPSLFTDDDTVFAPSVANVSGTQSITPSLITDSDYLFYPYVSGDSIYPSYFGIHSGDPLIIRHRFIPPMTLMTTVVIAIPLDQTITPETITDTETFPRSYFTGGTVSYGYRSGLDSSESVPLVLRHRFIPPVTLTVVIRLDPLSGDVSVSPTLFADADNFFAPTVSRGTVSVSPTLFTDADAFFAPSVTARVTVSPSLFSDADNFFAPTVSPGAVTVTPVLFADADTIFAPAIAGGGVQTVVTSQIVDVDNLFSPTLTAGGVSVTLSLFTDAEVFFAPTIALRLTPSLFTDADAFFAPAVKISVLPTLFTDADTLFAPTIGVSAVTVSPSRIVDAETLFTPVVASGVTPTMFTDAEVFFTPVIGVGTATVRPGLLVDAEQLFSLQLGYNQSVSVGSFTDDDTVFMPTFQLESHYDFPIGKSLDSDYGIRKSRLRRGPYIIGRR